MIHREPRGAMVRRERGCRGVRGLWRGRDCWVRRKRTEGGRTRAEEVRSSAGGVRRRAAARSHPFPSTAGLECNGYVQVQS